LTTPSLSKRIAALPRYEPHHHITESGEREYLTPLGTAASVTTILHGSRDNSGLEEWRESIGPERADFISSLASHRGTRHHAHIEQFLTDGTEPAFNFLYTPYWKSTRAFLNRIESPVLLEGAIWHPDGYAGTLDAIAYLPEDGLQPTLLDWKTADSPRNAAKLYEYSLQVAAYTAAANHVYGHMGLHITRALIVVAIADSPAQIEELPEDALAQLFRHFQARLQRFTYARSKRK
jgi:genome maintenance exonuclease 1